MGPDASRSASVVCNGYLAVVVSGLASKLRSIHSVVALAVAASTLAVYFQIHGHDFTEFDDRLFIIENPILADGLSPRAVIAVFSGDSGTEDFWFPLTFVSLMVDRDLHDLSPAGVLMGNLLLHIASSLLLYWSMWRMTASIWPSAFVAAVFALHPLHVESVAWAFERKDCLSGLFFMLTLLAYVRACERPGVGRHAVVALVFALGLSAKPSLVTLPFVLLLLDYWPLDRLGDEGKPLQVQRVLRSVAEKLPLFALAAGVSVITAASQSQIGLGGRLDMDVRVLNALESYVWYIGKTLWPSGLAVFYPHPLERISVPNALACGLALVSVTAIALRMAVPRPYLIVGWLWFIGTLIPMIGIVQAGNQARADRYTYIPMIGLTLIAAFGAVDWAGVHAHRRKAVAAAGLVACVAMSVLTFRQVGFWRNDFTLFEHAAAVTERNHQAHAQMARWKVRASDWEGALHHFELSVQYEPGIARTQFDLGYILVMLGEPERARPHLAAALEIAESMGQTELAALARRTLAEKR